MNSHNSVVKKNGWHFLFLFCYHSLARRRSVRVEVAKDVTSIQTENTEGVEADPMYCFIPVDRYGDNKDKTEPLEDRGGCGELWVWLIEFGKGISHHHYKCVGIS